MTTYNSWAEAARASIDERWGPMCEAKNNRAMVKISRETTCPLCKHLTKRHPNAQCGWDDRRKTICPLSDDPGKTSRKCCLDFREWDGATGETGGFPRALAAARRIKARLEVIAGGDGGESESGK